MREENAIENEKKKEEFKTAFFSRKKSFPIPLCHREKERKVMFQKREILSNRTARVVVSKNIQSR